jgi:hypothetical protein
MSGRKGTSRGDLLVIGGGATGLAISKQWRELAHTPRSLLTNMSFHTLHYESLGEEAIAQFYRLTDGWAKKEGSRARKASETSAFSYIALSSENPLVQAAVMDLAERVPEIVHARQEKLSQDNIDQLVDAYLKGAPTAPARHEIEMDNARERARFVEEFPCYTSRDLAELAGHEAANASATATRWKKARRIFGLPWKGSDLYPAFQFSEGRPRPVIERIIEVLPERFSPWQIAFWLTSSNSWLGGSTPFERLEDEAALLAAAARESEALGG